jgi:hypothetical protein
MKKINILGKQRNTNVKGKCFTNSEDITSFDVVWSHKQNLFKVEERPIDIVLIIKTQASDQKSVSICLI